MYRLLGRGKLLTLITKFKDAFLSEELEVGLLAGPLLKCDISLRR